MWLDAFLPKSGTMQKSAVPGVPSVPKRQGSTVWDTGDTTGHQPKKRCPGDEKGWEPSIHAGFGVVGTPGTRGTPQKQCELSIEARQRQSLAQFEFGLVRAEIEAGHDAGELHRVNNMAWEFMQTDGMAFGDAIKLAAEIIVSGQVAACEATYEDVQGLWQKVTHAKD